MAQPCVGLFTISSIAYKGEQFEYVLVDLKSS